MNIDQRCYGHIQAEQQLKALRADSRALKAFRPPESERLYLCCDTSVPEVGHYSLDEAVEFLSLCFDDYHDSDERDRQIEASLRKRLIALPIGHSTNAVPGRVIWAVIKEKS